MDNANKYTFKDVNKGLWEVTVVRRGDLSQITIKVPAETFEQACKIARRKYPRGCAIRGAERMQPKWMQVRE